MLHENDPDAYLSRARDALHRGAWRAALSDATSALGSAIYDSRAWKIKGIAHFELEEYSEAAESFLEGLNQNPQSQPMREGYWEAIARLNRGHQELSLHNATATLATDDNSATRALRRRLPEGVALTRDARPPSAAAHWDPLLADRSGWRAEHARRQRSPRAATATLTEAEDADADDMPAATFLTQIGLLDDDTPVAQSMMRRLGLPTSGSVPPGCRPLLELQLKLGALHERGRLGEIFSAASVVLENDGEASIGRHDLGRAAQLVLGVVLTRAQSEAAVAWIAGERKDATSVTLTEMEARLDELAHNPVYSDDDEDDTNSQASPPLSPGTDPPLSPGSDPPASPGSDFSN